MHGLAGAGGVGTVIAEWIVKGHAVGRRRGDGHPPLRPPRRASRSYARARALDAYSRYYDVVYPGEEREAGRPLRLPPAYERLRELDASFGEKAGWERVNWFESNAGGGDESLRPRRLGGPQLVAGDRRRVPGDPRRGRALRPVVVREARRARARAARAALGRICANEIDKPVGSAVYTQLLNDRGGIEADLTVTRVGEESFRVVTGTAFGTRDLAWIRRHLPNDGLGRRRRRERLARLLLPLGPARPRDPAAADRRRPLQRGPSRSCGRGAISVGDVPVFAQRITFVGELGWELYCPVEFGRALWDLLLEAGRRHGMVPGGYRAIDSMRLEKGYRVWGLDITPGDDAV